MKKIHLHNGSGDVTPNGLLRETITYAIPNPAVNRRVKAETGHFVRKNTWFTTEDNKNAAISSNAGGRGVIVNISTNVDWDLKP